jgi:hypothetical protein
MVVDERYSTIAIEYGRRKILHMKTNWGKQALCSVTMTTSYFSELRDRRKSARLSDLLKPMSAPAGAATAAASHQPIRDQDDA